jgi:hypothetical protein
MNWINTRWLGFRPLLVLATAALGLGAAGRALFHDWLVALVLGVFCAIGVADCLMHREARTDA